MDSFKPVSLEDRAEITAYLRLYSGNEASEYTFTNLYIWSPGEHIEWMGNGDYMLIRTKPGSILRYLMAFAQEGKLEDALEAAINSARAEGAPFTMHSLPEWYCDRVKACMPDRFLFEHEPDLDDYIYNASDLIRLSGDRYQSKRNHINRFRRLYGDRYTYVPFTQDMSDGCMAVYERWLSSKDDVNALEGERDSVRRALYHSAELELEGGVILMDGAPEAFSLGERLAGDMAVVHIEKVNVLIPELFSLINRDFITNAFSDALWINREEDMGDEGLRHAKQSYHPARMVRKYRAILKEDL